MKKTDYSYLLRTCYSDFLPLKDSPITAACIPSDFYITLINKNKFVGVAMKLSSFVTAISAASILLASVTSVVVARDLPNSGSDDSLPTIQNPFRPGLTSPSSAPTFRMPQRSNGSGSDRNTEDEGKLLQMFRTQENDKLSKMRQQTQQREQNFHKTKQACMQNTTTLIRERNKEREAMMKACRPTKVSLPVTQSAAGGTDVKSIMMAREQQSQLCKDKVVQFQKETQEKITEMKKSCIQVEKQVLGLMTNIAN